MARSSHWINSGDPPLDRALLVQQCTTFTYYSTLTSIIVYGQLNKYKNIRLEQSIGVTKLFSSKFQIDQVVNYFLDSILSTYKCLPRLEWTKEVHILLAFGCALNWFFIPWLETVQNISFLPLKHYFSFLPTYFHS